jgi:hypothetical protein
MDFPTRRDLFRIAADAALVNQPRVSRATIYRDGSTINIELAAMSAVGDEVIGKLVRVEAGLFLDSAQFLALDRLVFDRWGMLRKPASPGLVDLIFYYRDGTGRGFNLTIPAGTICTTADGTQVATTAAVTLRSGTTAVIVGARTVLAGEDQGLLPDTVTGIASSIPQAPAELVVNNPLASVGQSNEEPDDDLRARARAFYTTLVRATLEALIAGAASVPGVRRSDAFESLDSLGRPFGDVEVVVSDTFMESFVDTGVIPPGYAALSPRLSAAVTETLQQYRAAGVGVRVTTAIPRIVSVQLVLAVRAGVADPQAVVELARALVVVYVNAQGPGVPLTNAAVFDVLRLVSGLDINACSVVAPPATIVPTRFEVVRTTLANVAVL